MKASKMLISTLKEAPQEAIISSHSLMLRAGMIRKLVAGVYNYLPMGLRTLRKIENIIREEMDESGALEILSSAIQPKELWEESKRWEKYGPELMRFKDRHEREFCLGPTHEEIFTDLVRNEIKSRKNLPLNIYQIQTKYRDELRPRFGLMRGREFIMKDSYSFDLTQEGLDKSYQTMYKTYSKIFDRLDINYKTVLADTGSIGGNASHQFMALSNVGESDIIYCECGYAADIEKADSLISDYKDNESLLDLEEISTPNVKTIEDLAKFLNVNQKDIAKAVLFKDLANDEVVCVIVRGDREVNLIKVINLLNIAEHEIRVATADEIININSVPGFVGPKGLTKAKILIDEEVKEMKNVIIGANKKDYHYLNANFERDFNGIVSQFRNSSEGDLCPVCHQPLKLERGIEVGQIFKLGTKYSLAMNCTYQDEFGKNQPMIMGCYGIGVTRTMASIIEQHHDDYGIIWPVNIAPYHVVVIIVNIKDQTMFDLGNEIYLDLKKKGIEVVLDDRDERAGFKFKDWELIGLPYQIIVGKNAVDRNVEFKTRKTLEKEVVTVNEAIKRIIENCK